MAAGCDALCYGSMMSARSALSLIGSVLVGRMSDKMGRLHVLWIGLGSSILSYWISYSMPSIMGMWLSIIPSSLLNQNYSVLKALFSDYSHEKQTLMESSTGKPAAAVPESERASAMGRLGMAVGIAFMIGPALGATLFGNYNDAMCAAMLLSVLSGFLLAMLPKPVVGARIYINLE